MTCLGLNIVDFGYMNDFDFNILLFVEKYVDKELFEQAISSSDSSAKHTNSSIN